MALQREAGGEPKPVQVAVVHTIRNRVRAAKKPICTVVAKKRQFTLLKKRPRPDILKTARMAWNSHDSTGGATHFHDPREYPYWARVMKRTRVVGKLRFYRKRPS